MSHGHIELPVNNLYQKTLVPKIKFCGSELYDEIDYLNDCISGAQVEQARLSLRRIPKRRELHQLHACLMHLVTNIGYAADVPSVNGFMLRDNPDLDIPFPISQDSYVVERHFLPFGMTEHIPGTSSMCKALYFMGLYRLLTDPASVPQKLTQLFTQSEVLVANTSNRFAKFLGTDLGFHIRPTPTIQNYLTGLKNYQAWIYTKELRTQSFRQRLENHLARTESVFGLPKETVEKISLVEAMLYLYYQLAAKYSS